MKLLLDTHIILWWLSNPSGLSLEAQNAIKNKENDVFVSTASIWEISIKSNLGKLKIPDNMLEVFREENIQPLPILFSHALLAGNLPIQHKDPFDRMLIAQAKIENLTFVTRDDKIIKYREIEFIIA